MGTIEFNCESNTPEPSEPTWFVLYDGESCDGRGFPTFKKRTTDAKAALDFLRANASSPYWIGAVTVITDDAEAIIRSLEEWLDFFGP